MDKVIIVIYQRNGNVWGRVYSVRKDVLHYETERRKGYFPTLDVVRKQSIDHCDFNNLFIFDTEYDNGTS